MNKYDNTFNKTKLCYYNKVKQKSTIVQLKKKKRLKRGGLVSLPSKSQSGWKFENKATEG